MLAASARATVLNEAPFWPGSETIPSSSDQRASGSSTSTPSPVGSSPTHAGMNLARSRFGARSPFFRTVIETVFYSMPGALHQSAETALPRDDRRTTILTPAEPKSAG